MIRPVLRHPHPTLRQGSLPVTVFDAALEALVADMFETMRAEEGLGLAAVQVGELKRVSVLWLSRAPLVLINPQLVERDKPQLMLEGCLSLPGAAAYVRRFTRIKVKAQDVKGEPFVIDSVGVDAQAIQHEMDHMIGKLYVDRLKPGARQQVLHKARDAVPTLQ